MTSLEQIKSDIKSEIKVDEKGVGYTTIRGCARIVDVQHTTLLRAFSGGAKNGHKLCEMLTRQGFEPGAFSDSGVPDLAVAIVAKYYAYSEYSGARCTELAKLADLAFSGIGVRAWFQEVVGWHHEKKESATNPQDEIEALIVAQQTVFAAILDTRRQLKQYQQEQEEIRLEVKEIQVKQKAAEKAFVEAPLPDVATPALTLRAQINRIVRDFCFATGCEHHFAWRQLYREFRDLYHVDLHARAKNSGNGMTKLDVCESMGMLKDLYATAFALFSEVIKNA